MTDVIVEFEDGRIIAYYINDGLNDVVLLTQKGSEYYKKIAMPKEFIEGVRALDELRMKAEAKLVELEVERKMRELMK